MRSHHALKMMKKKIFTWLAALLLAEASTSVVSGATVLWSSPQSISGDADVSTSGSIILAANIGSATATTVNGVTFAAYNNTAAVPGLTDTLNLNPGAVFGNAAAPYSALSAGYQALIGSGRYTDGATLETLNLSGLSIGQSYLVQFWVNDSRGGGTSGRTLDLTAGATAVLDFNVQNVAGGLGQYVIGTFTANATTQSFDLLGSHSAGTTDSTQINGFQLRAVPEPSQALLALIGVVSVGLRRRRAVARRKIGS
jgi:hypothetical protein